jgi:hypothetical protein
MENSNPPEKNNSQTQPAGGRLCMTVGSDLVPLFLRLLSQGIVVFVQADGSLRELLCGQLGIRDDYLDERIQTIFLNSKPVDDVDAAIVANESTLALSGPMPGLAGATLRRGGFFSGMRSQISYDKTLSGAPKGTAKIYLKLFNLVVKELGPSFLKKGVWIPAKKLKQFILENQEQLQSDCQAAEFGGRTMEIGEFAEMEVEEKLILFKLKTVSDTNSG